MPDHLLHGIAMVGVFVTTPKNGIYNQPAPIHLQWLKALFLFVGRFNPVAAFGIIIVHHHGINTQLDQLGLLYLQTPNKQGLQQTTKQKYPSPGKGVEKPLYPMRRSHIGHVGLNTAGIAGVFGKLIKISQMPTGTISHKTQNLLEEFKNRDAFFTFSDRTEKPVKQWKNLNLVQIRNEQGQTRSASQTLAGGLNGADFQFLFTVIFAISVHRVLYLMGLAMLVNTVVGFNKHYSMLPSVRGLFYFLNRSD
jgi:hypothetical protein